MIPLIISATIPPMSSIKPIVVRTGIPPHKRYCVPWMRVIFYFNGMWNQYGVFVFWYVIQFRSPLVKKYVQLFFRIESPAVANAPAIANSWSSEILVYFRIFRSTSSSAAIFSSCFFRFRATITSDAVLASSTTRTFPFISFHVRDIVPTLLCSMLDDVPSGVN